MQGQTNKAILKNELQRNLRKAMTDAELRLWRVLRGRQMAGYKFRRQHPFGDFILDFVCLDVKLVIEVDGGQHSEQMEDDAVRSNKLVGAGFRILRFWNNEVLGELEVVKERIWMALQKADEPHPHPDPLLEGEGARRYPVAVGKYQ